MGSVWFCWEGGHSIHCFAKDICSLQEMCVAIKDMHLRGAGLIGLATCFEP